MAAPWAKRVEARIDLVEGDEAAEEFIDGKFS